ncbi:NUDIX hydrolase [Candidatus Pacearchaeota archaeon]|nr:NUDIX hydrolase [Candidatus Pacearchaeota archaeon]
MFKEYAIENGREIDLKPLEVGFIEKEDFIRDHQQTIILCHDAFIKYNGGILLVTRDNVPAKDILWPVGGKVQRGVNVEESLRKKVKAECGLEIKNLEDIGIGRTLFHTDPFGHGKGTDSFNLVYFVEGEGELNLDRLHKSPRIIKPKDYTPSFRESLHPYVRDHMDICIEKLRGLQ